MGEASRGCVGRSRRGNDASCQRRKVSGRAEQSRAEQSRAEQSRAEQSRAEQSRAEQSRAEQSRAEQRMRETPREQTRDPPVTSHMLGAGGQENPWNDARHKDG
jgi:flagellar biosynthesis GTPase FlhF